jgi:NADP-dependent 3-hydroxy acid dehydrogenase YdfG
MTMMTCKKKKVAIVIGSSNGIRFEKCIARNGFHTYAAVRNLDKSQALINIVKNMVFQVVELDVSNDENKRRNDEHMELRHLL